MRVDGQRERHRRSEYRDGERLWTREAWATIDLDRRWRRRVQRDEMRRQWIRFGPGVVQLQNETTMLSRTNGKRRKRGLVRGWSGRSRFRLNLACAQIWWPPQLAIVFVTLTYPKEFPRESEVFKEHLRRFRIAWERRYGRIHAVWVMEFQDRGAPHYHLAIVMRQRPLMPLLREWVGETWHKIAGEGDHWCRGRQHAECFHQHGDHRRCWHHRVHAGREAVKLAEGPKAIISYFRKELAKGKPAGKKAYQKTLPAWLDDPDQPKGAGRWWGIWNLEPSVIDEHVTHDEYQLLRRIERRILRGRRHALVHRPWRWEHLTTFDQAKPQWTLSEKLDRYLQRRRGRWRPPRDGFLEFERRALLLLTVQLSLDQAHLDLPPARPAERAGRCTPP